MRYYNYWLSIVIVLLSCSNTSDSDELWNKAIHYYDTKDYDNCIVFLNKIIETYPADSKKPESYYLISEIYLNEYKNYDISIEYLKRIISLYPNNEVSKKSLFTLAYIHGNYIDSFTESTNYYNQFIEKYPNDDLIPSVHYELENLESINLKIDSLLNK